MPEKDEREVRTFSYEIRADDDKYCLTGRPIVFNQRTDMGWYDEIIDAGALDITDLRDVRMLVNHDTTKIPLARSRNNTEHSTMQLKPDADGLVMTCYLDCDNNADAKSLYSAVKRGDITGMSFMFTVDKDSWDDIDTDHPTRHIRSIKRVFEVSAVTFPAYAQTSIQARGLGEALDSAKTSLDSARAKKRTLEYEHNLCRLKILMEV